MEFRINKMLFPGKKHKALTLSYDDGRCYDRRMVDLMNHYGVKGTFNLNTGNLGKTEEIYLGGKKLDGSTIREDEIAELYKGHEVASHTADHTAMTDRGSSVIGEILKDREILERETSSLVQGFAYPFGMYDKESFSMLRAAGIQYARTVFSNGTFDIPKDFLEWHPTCHHDDPRIMELARQFCEESAILDLPQIFYLWGHSYEFELNNNWEVLEKFLAYVSGYRDQIWMATNIEIVNYITAFKNLQFSADGKKVYNPTVCTVYLESCGKAYEILPGELTEFKKSE